MKQIKTLEELAAARDKKRSVVCPKSNCFKGPTPAAFALNYTGEIILRLLRAGLFIYEPRAKRPLHKTN